MARNNRTISERYPANHLAYVLELLGSLLYVIAAIYILASFGGYSLNPRPFIDLIAGGIWLPFFYSAAIVGTVLLFIVSFTNLMRSRSRSAHRYGMMVSVLTGLAWIGFTAGNLFLSILVIIGFIVSAVGSAYGMVDLLESER